jgi:hypothetical protein
MTTEETERQQFQGVVCLHCKAPIPVPAVVGQTGSSLRDGVESSQGNSQVFNVRCPVCHKEKPYWRQEIVTFDGTPEHKIQTVGAASMGAFRQDQMGKAAKA